MTRNQFKLYVYVDGESHYMRARESCLQAFGDVGAMDKLRSNLPMARAVVKHECQFFWDAGYLYTVRPDKVYYFTSVVTGSENDLHDYHVFLRTRGNVEPYIIHEKSQLQKRREDIREKSGLIEKPKGLDIALTTKLLEDAVNDNFTHCHLFTSDVDYIPVIEAVKRLGKVVHVYGHRNGLGKHSKLEYIPDEFHDIGTDFMKNRYSITTKEG